jgi:hypothetical protein
MLVIAALLGLAGCVRVRPNPEQQACTGACVEAKNSCLVRAPTAEEVRSCDESHRVCVQPCLAMPRHLRVESR